MSKWPNDRGLVLVFEQGGFVYAYRSLDEAAESIESIGVVDGHCLGAFSDRGEVIAMGEGDLLPASLPPASLIMRPSAR